MIMLFRLSILVAAALMLSSPASATVTKAITQVFCAPPAELQSILPLENIIMRGPAGTDGKSGFGEVWHNPKTGAWTFVQRVNENLVCVLLGGAKGFEPVKGRITGAPA